MNKSYFLLIRILCICSVAVFVFCSPTIQNDKPDQSEFVSVWQYLKIYSIYQDKIADDPFLHNDPDWLMASLNDTLRGNRYTGYSDSDGVIFYGYPKSLRKEVAKSKIVYLDSLTDSCCLLTIKKFMDKSADIYNEFLQVLPQVSKFPNVIFDLRNNGGGDLVIMDSIIEDILPAGKHFIHVNERVYDNKTKQAHTADSDWVTTRPQKDAFINKKIAVLIDGYSASASEIFAIAMKDCAGAPLFGVKSYGKAIGQIKLNRRDRPMLQITFLHLFRIVNQNGKDSYFDYHRKGIVPDVVSSDWSTTLYNAVKALEPSVKLNKIKFPSGSAGFDIESQSGLYKSVNEEDLE